MTLIEFFENFYIPLRLRGRSEDTERLYRISIGNFGKSLKRPATLEDLNDLALSFHLASLRRRGRAAATANKDRAQLLAIWRFANRRGLVETWPDVTKEVEPQRAPEAWMPGELERLFDYVRSLDGWIGENRASQFWEAFLNLALATGERVGALRQLQWSHISEDWIRVPAELRKGKRRDRVYRLDADTLAALSKLHKDRKQIFPWPYCENYLWRKYSEVLKGAGLSCDRRSKFHKLRRTTASAVHAAGHDATEAMDHQDRRTTKAYLDERLTRIVHPSDILASYLSRASLRRPPPSSERTA